MALLNWSDQFSVGIQELDNQHKKLIGFINSLHSEKMDKGNGEAIGSLLDELLEYTRTHFKEEEKLMKEYEYPEYTTHKAQHSSLLLKVEIMQKKFFSGDKDIFTDIAILLNDWLAEHILVEDKNYGPFLNSKGIT